jgi:hypothetical protein
MIDNIYDDLTWIKEGSPVFKQNDYSKNSLIEFEMIVDYSEISGAQISKQQWTKNGCIRQLLRPPKIKKTNLC